ncbi:DinB family protein [Geodermatophilus sp. DSM 44513]|uniref:DinB family protein n=1 Tax=Geodermatophilus sp. DSM 44513 TaxID=1528104 RepID=UPI00127D21F5|nr:DinB family protein [Geodermatophilus sp. DSM 44513]WNV73727.1 DinB family protein [Geodermatophilus sp. DSM 44513]
MTPEDTRTQAPLTGDEGTLLTGFLEYQRQTLAWKCAGLTPQQLATRAVPTSDLTLLGVVRHLAAVETGWLVGFGGLPYDSWPDVVRDRDEQFRVDPATVTQDDVDAAWATWRAVADAVGTVVARLPPDTVDRPWRRDDECSLRWILLHLVEEYARHNGHADLLREAIDGATGE